MRGKLQSVLQWAVVPLVSLAFLGVVGYLGSGHNQLRAVDLFVCWEPQAQFTGYYVANELGMFRDEGLKVTIRHDLGVGESLTEVVKRDDAYLATLFPNVLSWIENNPKVDVFSVITAGCNLGWASNAPKSELDDILTKRSLQSWWGPQDLMLRGYLKSRGFDTGDLDRRVLAGVTAGSQSSKTGVLAMAYNELLDSAQFLGQSTEFTTYCDLGFPMFEDALMSRAATGSEDVANQARMARAIWRGWDYAQAHPERALDIVMKQSPRKPREHQRRQLEIFLKTLTPRGALPSDYELTLETMRKMIQAKVFKNPTPVTDLVDRIAAARSLRHFSEVERP